MNQDYVNRCPWGSGPRWIDGYLHGPITASGDQSFPISAGGAQMRYIRYCTLAGSTNWATLGELKAYGVSVQRQ